MKTIRLTHANLETPLEVSTQNIFYYYFSAANKCTHVVAPGGAFFPAKESVEQIKALISSGAGQPPVSGGDNHGTK